MRTDPRRLAALALAAVLVIGVGAGIVGSVLGNLSPGTVPIHGVIGSEKLPFFQDARVLAALRRGGFEVTVSTAGSRQIASLDLSNEGFAFPAGAPAAEKIRRDRTGTTSVVPFYTPMAIATWRPIVDILEANALLIDRTNYQALDLEAYMSLVERDTRWKDLRENAAYSVNKSVLITSTDVRRSNSGAMYLSLASYIANGNAIVTIDGGVDAIINRTAPLFLRQGFVESSSEGPFEDYLVQGMGKAPMVMIYESQFLARAASGDGSITADMALIYPQPTILSKHTFVSLTPDGARLGQFLTNDLELRSLATEYGFRTTDTAAFRAFVQEHQLTVPDTLLDVIDPPSYETLEAMIGRLEQLYTGTSPLPSSASSSPGASQ